MLRIVSIIVFVILLSACKKTENRRCWKSFGEQTTLSLPLDSIEKMRLNSKLTYVMHQSELRKVEIIGGENMVNLVEVKTENYQLEITNRSSCNFLRDFDKKVVVHLYYPRFTEVYAEVSDSLIFMDTIRGDKMDLEMREAGGVTILNTNMNDVRITVSAGTGHFIVGGFAKYADFKTQGQGFGDCLAVKTKNLRVYQNSRAPLKVNLDNTKASIVIQGAGDVGYIGEANSLVLTQNGAGNFIKY